MVPRHAAARHARGSSEASSRWSPWSHCSAVVWSGPASASDSVATCNPPCPPRRLLHRQGPPPHSPSPLPPLMRGARVEPGRSQGGDGALSGSECCCRECRSDQVTRAAAGAHRRGPAVRSPAAQQRCGHLRLACHTENVTRVGGSFQGVSERFYVSLCFSGRIRPGAKEGVTRIPESSYHRFARRGSRVLRLG